MGKKKDSDERSKKFVFLTIGIGLIVVIAVAFIWKFPFDNEGTEPFPFDNNGGEPSPTPTLNPYATPAPTLSPIPTLTPLPTPTPASTPSPTPFPLSFSTSFESGNPASEVSYIEVTPPPSYPQDQYVWGVVTGSQEQAHTGLWSAKCYSVNGGPAGRCRLNVIVEPAKRLHVRAYFYIESWDGYIQVLRYWTTHPDDGGGTGEYVAEVVISKSTIMIQLGRSGEHYSKTANREFVTGRWYAIEMMLFIHETQGEYRVWVDDQEITELTYVGKTNFTNWITEVRAGIVIYQQNRAPATVFVDDYAVNTTKIGLTSK